MQESQGSPCPNCQSELSQDQLEGAFYWTCKRCKGCAITLPGLKRSVQARSVQELWGVIYKQQLRAQRACPLCKQLMAEVALQLQNTRLVLDACKGCHLVWFDTGELELLPRIPEAERKAARNKDDAKKPTRGPAATSQEGGGSGVLDVIGFVLDVGVDILKLFD